MRTSGTNAKVARAYHAPLPAGQNIAGRRGLPCNIPPGSLRGSGFRIFVKKRSAAAWWWFPSRTTRQPGLGPTSRRHPTGIPKGRGRGDEARGGKSDRATPLPSGLSDDDSAGPSQSRPSKWRSPLLGLGVSSEARNGKQHPTGFRSALLARLVAATRQPVRAICTRATRSGCREYRERPLSSRATSSPVQSATPSATIASTGAT